jgi:hypothetical protein
MITFYRDPTEEHEMIYDPSKEDAFWNNQDNESDAAKYYVKELEAKISSTRKELTKLRDYFKTTDQILLTNEIEGILKGLR